MPLRIPANVTTTKPSKYYQPDLIYGRKYQPVGVKGGIAGAFQQPIEYTARYAWRHYGGTEKTRALALLAQKQIPLWVKTQIVKHYRINKYYAKKTKNEVHNKYQKYGSQSRYKYYQ